jgi:hypothetical protein
MVSDPLVPLQGELVAWNHSQRFLSRVGEMAGVSSRDQNVVSRLAWWVECHDK